MGQLRSLSRFPKIGFPLEHLLNRLTNRLPERLSKAFLRDLRNQTEFIILFVIRLLTIGNIANDRLCPVMCNSCKKEDFLLFPRKMRMRMEKSPHHPLTPPMMLQIIHIWPKQSLPLCM